MKNLTFKNPVVPKKQVDFINQDSIDPQEFVVDKIVETAKYQGIVLKDKTGKCYRVRMDELLGELENHKGVELLVKRLSETTFEWIGNVLLGFNAGKPYLAVAA